MRQYISHILSILLAICFVGCNEDIITSDNNDGNEHVYTLQLAISDSPATRSLTSVSVGSFKTRWCYGDKVTLKPNNSSTKYEFVIETPAGKTMGDPVDDRVATFKYSGPSIPNFTNFTGTLNYDCGIDKDEVITSGYTVVNKTKLETNTTNDYIRIEIKGKPYVLQMANDNTDHLKCLDNLSVSISGRNLKQPRVISMSRNFSILKIVLDDIYYPIYGGSVLCVKGFKKLSDGVSVSVGMVLGMGMVDAGNGTNLYSPISLLGTEAQNPADDKIFYVASAQKDPITGYAVRDDAHKLVAYLPVFDELEVGNEEKIAICLRDSWALDSYFWETDKLKPFKLPLGSVYTIDFTQKVGGRHKYESYAAINLGSSFSNAFGNLAARNMGAKSVTDTGEFYMVGHDRPIFAGGHYPKYPDITCYYYCQPIENVPYMLYYNTNGEAFKSEVVRNSNYTGISMLKLPGDEEHSIEDWWTIWVKKLGDMPNFKMKWNLPENASINNFKSDDKTPVLNNVVKVGGNPIGVRLSSKRTGHSVFLPLSGVLEASEKNVEMRYITSDAVAGIKPGTEKHAVFMGQGLSVNKTGDAIQMAAYSFKIGDDNTTVTREKILYDLDIAGPVRPSLFEADMYGLLNAIPGY